MKNYNTYIVIMLAILTFAGCNAKETTVPPLINLQVNNEAVDAYYSNGQYDKEVAKIAAEADVYIKKNLKSGKIRKPALVFDIDDTLFANHSLYKRMGYRFSLRLWTQWVNAGDIPALEPMKELLLRYCDQMDVFIITGRNVFQKAQTIRNLQGKGISGWTTVFFKEAWDRELSATEYKSRILKQLMEKEGYFIVANFGDQESDFPIPIQGQNYKLPNYLYITK